jgi:hypothetical protein
MRRGKTRTLGGYVDTSDLLRHWRFRVHRVQRGHYLAGRRYDRFHFLLGIPAVCLTAIVGSAVFSSLAAEKQTVYGTIVIGLLSITALVLTALQTFLKYSELAERHKIAGARFADLKHQIEMIAVFQTADKDAIRSKLEAVEQLWTKVREESPNLPAGIWSSVEKELTLEKDVEIHPNFGKPGA